MSVKNTMVKGFTGAGVASVLAVGMLAGQAVPAQAILPVVPVVILGATAGVGGVSITGAAVSLGVTTVVAGLALSLTQPGAFDWLGDVADWFAPAKDEAGTPVESVKETPYVPMPSSVGVSDPLFDGYVWDHPQVTVLSAVPTVAYGTTQIRFRYKQNQLVTLGEPVRGAAWATGTCKHPTDASIPPVMLKGRMQQGGMAQPAAGYQEADLYVSCASLGKDVYPPWIPTEVNIQPATTAQKTTAIFQSNDYYNQYRWAPGVTSYRAADFAPANPQYRATVTCVTPDGVKTELSMNTDITPGGSVNVPSCAAAGLGAVADSLVVGFADGDTLRQPIFTATPVKPDQYLECDPAFGKVCKFQIFVDGAPCVVGSPQCVSWAGLHKVNPSRVKCMYGTRQVDISGCAILEGAYVTGGSPAVDTNTDGNPDTWTEPIKVPGFVPHIIPSPGADPVPDPNPNPNPDPTPQPNPNPDPDIGPEPGTDPGVTPMPTTGTNPNSNPGGENCLGAMWTWNPLDWVMVPVQCALTWAFVPDPAVLEAKGAEITTRFTEIGIAAPVEALNSALDAIPDGGAGCMGPAMALKISSFEKTIYPIAACTEPMSTVAVAANALGSVYLVLFGSVSVVRAVSNAFGYSFNLGKAPE